MIDNTEARRYLRETSARKMPAPVKSSTDKQREVMFGRPLADQYKPRGGVPQTCLPAGLD